MCSNCLLFAATTPARLGVLLAMGTEIEVNIARRKVLEIHLAARTAELNALGAR
jgi:hypothetical protein